MAKQNYDNIIAIRSQEKLDTLKEKFSDVVISLNILESKVLDEQITPSNTGYHVGRMMAAMKDIMVMLKIKIEIE